MHTSEPTKPYKGNLVVVIAGAGARGAYEAGALAYILPKLARDGLKSTILLGTSAGAINAVLWASRATQGKDLETVGQEVKKVWLSIEQSRVFVQPLLTVLPTLGEYVAGLASPLTTAVRDQLARLLHRPTPSGEVGEIRGVLDTRPLRDTAGEVLQIEQIRKNITDGALLGVGVVATTSPMNGSGGRSRIFLDTSKAIPVADPDSSVDFVGTQLADEHVLASAAIPIAFPAVRVVDSHESTGWYFDGGVRLNAPIEPAVKLDADTLLVVSSHATEYPLPPALSDLEPDVLDLAAQSIHSVLGDGMIEDLRNLKRINAMVDQAEKAGATLCARGKRPYRRIDVITVSPANGTLSPLAASIASKLTLWKKLNHWLLSFLISGAGRGAGNNELLSYLLFEPEYFEEQFKLGEEDAKCGWQKFLDQRAQNLATVDAKAR